MQASLARFEGKKATLVAISNETIEDSKALSEKLTLGFPLLSDPKLDTIRAYAVEHVGKGIARPATYIIAPD
ncbi:MAG: redoxin domain-containing protein, partial [Nannocystaceae bacterium]